MYLLLKDLGRVHVQPALARSGQDELQLQLGQVSRRVPGHPGVEWQLVRDHWDAPEAGTGLQHFGFFE